MPFPLIPIAILGAGALIGTGAFFSKDEVYNNSYQTSIQKDFITNETVFDFTSSYWENSTLGITNSNEVTTKKASNMQTDQTGKTQDNTQLLLIAGAVIAGGYFLLK
jgi:hypothetical protein